MSKKETKLYNKIAAGVPDNCRLFRNNVGSYYQGIRRRVKIDGVYKTVLTDIRLIECGLFVGSSDQIGYTTIEITQEMVGKKIAVFTAIEAKAENGKASEEQLNFIDQVLTAGGIAGVIKNAEEAKKLIDEFLK
jgi:hypothetical protein